MSTAKRTPKLLTAASANPKTAKGDKLPYVAALLHLAPANLSGYNTCPYASGNLELGTGCVSACLNTAGHGGIGGPDNSVQRARIRKTRMFFEHKADFMAQLVAETESLVRKARKHGKAAALRLNGTSDIGWTRVPCTRNGQTYVNLMAAFPEVTFYDYTKVPSRIGATLPDNYSLTFSLSESNDVHAAQALAVGMNVAVVLQLKDKDPMPTTWAGYPVLDGTLHDFRFLDAKGGFIIGLRPKGKAKKDTSGFVRSLDATIDTTRKVQLAVTSLAAD